MKIELERKEIEEAVLKWAEGKFKVPVVLKNWIFKDNGPVDGVDPFISLELKKK